MDDAANPSADDFDSSDEFKTTNNKSPNESSTVDGWSQVDLDQPQDNFNDELLSIKPFMQIYIINKSCKIKYLIRLFWCWLYIKKSYYILVFFRNKSYKIQMMSLVVLNVGKEHYALNSIHNNNWYAASNHTLNFLVVYCYNDMI